MIFACRMTQKDNPENKPIHFGTEELMENYREGNADKFDSEIGPATFAEMGAEIKRLEGSLMFAELQLENCSWESGESNRRKVAFLKREIEPLVAELKAAVDAM